MKNTEIVFVIDKSGSICTRTVGLDDDFNLTTAYNACSVDDCLTGKANVDTN